MLGEEAEKRSYLYKVDVKKLFCGLVWYSRLFRIYNWYVCADIEWTEREEC
jgi:hypothetical protein